MPRRWWQALWIWLPIVAAVGLAMRVAYLIDYSDSPLFGVASGLDVQAYWEAAQRILAGNWDWQRDTTHGVLYPFVLAGWLRVGGEALAVVRAIQLLLGLAAGIMVAVAIGRRCGTLAAVCTAVLWVLCIPLIYYEAELLCEGTVLLLHAGVLALLIPARVVGGWRAVSVGLLLGLAAITHATAILFALLIIGWLWWHGWRAARGRVFRNAALACLGLALPIIPVAIYNTRAAGELVFLQGTGGLNFYIGNNPAADGTPYVRPGPDWDYLLALPGLEAGLPETASHSGFYYSQAGEHIRTSPARWLLLLLKKAALSVSATEITASTPMSAIRGDVALPRWVGIGFGVLLPLALAGLLIGGTRQISPAWLLILAYILSQTIYVAAGRYRVPMLPGMFVLAGLGLAQVILSLQTRSWKKLGIITVLLGVGVLVAWLPLVPRHNDDPAEGALARAMAYRQQQDWTNVGAELWQALKIRADYAPALLTLGQMYEELGRRDGAVEQYQTAVDAHPGYAAAELCLAEALLKRDGDLEVARPHYLAALQAHPEDVRIHFLFARALLIWEEWASAAKHFRFVLKRHADDMDAARGLGEALANLGQHAEAVHYLEQAAPAMPNNVRLWTRLARLRAASPDETVRNAEAALQCGQHAVELTRAGHPGALDALAMALANAGYYEQAVEAATFAAELARQLRDAELQEAIKARRELYRRREPYRDPS
ncbi:MAG: tetratricopeptide repeat protein [Planctomycetota bacterium]